MNQLLKSKKGIIFAIPAVIVLILAGVFLLPKGEETYRSIKVYQIEGDAQVQRGEDEPIIPYNNMMLENADIVKTLVESSLYLEMDGDKYLMARQNTVFSLEATGNAKDSKTKIVLEEGEIIVHITNPLSEDSLFEIGTGNSTMAVRGTSFRVSALRFENGKIDTVLEVLDGKVSVAAIKEDGSLDTEEKSVSAGKSVIISDVDGKPTIEEKEDGIDYSEFDVDILEFIKLGIEKGNDMTVPENQIDEIISQKQQVFTVTFVYGDQTFATQRVSYGEKVQKPMLLPDTEGEWDFDFETPVTENIVISWKK